MTIPLGGIVRLLDRRTQLLAFCLFPSIPGFTLMRRWYSARLAVSYVPQPTSANARTAAGSFATYDSPSIAPQE